MHIQKHIASPFKTQNQLHRAASTHVSAHSTRHASDVLFFAGGELTPAPIAPAASAGLSPWASMLSHAKFSPSFIKTYEDISDGRVLHTEGALEAEGCGNIAELLSKKGYLWAKDVAVTGNVTAQDGDIEFFSSNAQGPLKASGEATVEQSNNIHSIEAGSHIWTEDVLVKNDVVSQNGDITLKETDVKGKVQALKGNITVDDSDEIGNIDAAGWVRIHNAKIKQGIKASNSVEIDGKQSLVEGDIEVRSTKPGTIPTVRLGPGVTVKGNIHFENGQGRVLLDKGAKLLGQTNGQQESVVTAYAADASGYCDPNLVDYKNVGDCNPVIDLNHNPFNLTKEDLDAAPPCSAANTAKPWSIKSLLMTALLVTTLPFVGRR